MELLVQPGDALGPILKGIDRAKSSVEIVIFRCDRTELEKALARAVDRGVFVHALIASTNRNGEESLRELEMRLLGAGVTVARTAGDLVRYHAKYVIIDRRRLYVLAFNFTAVDLKHSRSFGIATTNRQAVQEAAALFEADTKRQPYSAGSRTLVVSPANARKELAALIRKAKKELLIYDPSVSDPLMVRLLEQRAAAGVDVRIIGKLGRKSDRLAVRKITAIRLHTRTIIRDGREAFIGSQSLRALELDARREVGIIFHDRKSVKKLIETFTADWERAGQPAREDENVEPAAKVAKRVAKALAGDLPPVAPVLEGAVKEVVGRTDGVKLDPEKVEDAVSEAVKDAVREVVRNVVEEAVSESEDS